MGQDPRTFLGRLSLVFSVRGHFELVRKKDLKSNTHYFTEIRSILVSLVILLLGVPEKRNLKTYKHHYLKL